MSYTISLAPNSQDAATFTTSLRTYRDLARDFLVDPSQIEPYADEQGSIITLQGLDLPAFAVRPHAHGQLATVLGIPVRFYERLRTTAPDIYNMTTRRFLDEIAGTPRLVRATGDSIRAILSNRYARIDNWDLAAVVLPILQETGATFRRLNVSESDLDIQAIFWENRAVDKIGDTVAIGVSVRNNEVGQRQVEIAPFAWTLSCRNGAVINELALKRRHLGSALSSVDGPVELFRQETLDLSNKAFLSALEDVVRHTASEACLETILRATNMARETPMLTAPHAVVQDITRRRSLTEATEAGILECLLTSRDFSQYGLHAATTLYAQRADPTEAVDLEVLGGDILMMARREFDSLGRDKR